MDISFGKLTLASLLGVVFLWLVLQQFQQLEFGAEIEATAAGAQP
jgi:hypothetical protein